MWDGWAVVIESRDIKLHGLLTSATIVRVVTLTLWKLLRFFELIYLPAVCTMAFVSAISGFSPTVFGCSVIEYHLFRGGERERERDRGDSRTTTHGITLLCRISLPCRLPPSYPPRLFVNQSRPTVYTLDLPRSISRRRFWEPEIN